MNSNSNSYTAGIPPELPQKIPPSVKAKLGPRELRVRLHAAHQAHQAADQTTGRVHDYHLMRAHKLLHAMTYPEFRVIEAVLERGNDAAALKAHREEHPQADGAAEAAREDRRRAR